MRSVAVVALLGWALLSAAGCNEAQVEIKCAPMSKRVCTCDNGWEGLQTCDMAQVFGVCECQPPIVAGMGGTGGEAGAAGVGGTGVSGTSGGDDDAGMMSADSAVPDTGATAGTGGTAGTGAEPGAYGACKDAPDCGGTDKCVVMPLPAGSYCSAPCMVAADCPAAPDGTAVPTCTLVGLGPAGDCNLACGGFPPATCPTGMVCNDALFGPVCIWPG